MTHCNFWLQVEGDGEVLGAFRLGRRSILFWQVGRQDRHSHGDFDALIVLAADVPKQRLQAMSELWPECPSAHIRERLIRPDNIDSSLLS